MAARRKPVDAAMIFAGAGLRKRVQSCSTRLMIFRAVLGRRVEIFWHAQTNRCEIECHRACAYTTCFVEMAYASTRSREIAITLH